MDEPAASPSATGPAGAHIEAKIAATYLLAMLLEAEGRGAPGVRIDRVKLQRGAEGHPLDDVIISGRDLAGHPAGLDIQAKRAITFSPGDAVFQKVLGQICETLKRTDDAEASTALAIATSQTSRKISGPYQDLLTWARQIQEATVFSARLARSGSASEDMRTFVATIRAHLAQAGLADSDEAVWRLLRRLHILVFDFSTADSASQALALEQCARALDPEQMEQAPALWSALIDLALEVASAGGDLDRSRVSSLLEERGFRLVGLRRHGPSRAALAEGAMLALADIDDHIAGQMLLRPHRALEVHQALDAGRYVEIRGTGGVGKSGVLKHVARQLAERSRIIVLTPERTPPGGALAFRDHLGFTGTVRELLSDIAAAGGGVLIIDGLDNFSGPVLQTARDLVRLASDVPGFCVLATLRQEGEQRDLLPNDVLNLLGPVVVEIGELDSFELDELKHALPAVSALLADHHPAKAVARNLYRLKRLLRVPNAASIRTEVDLAEVWWKSADGDAEPDGLRDRRRLLGSLASQVLGGAVRLDASTATAAAVDALVLSGSLKDLGGDRVTFAHDVLRDWAVFNHLNEDPQALYRLPLGRTAPPALARGVELLARQRLEQGVDAADWSGLLARLSDNANGSWRRNALLALVRSESGEALLAKTEGTLLGDGGALLDELIRTLMAVDVQTAGDFYAKLGSASGADLTGLSIPRGPSWMRLVGWVAALGPRLPPQTLPSVVGLFASWLRVTWGFDRISRTVLEEFFRLLREIDGARAARPYGRLPVFDGVLSGDQIDALESTLRLHVAGFARARPDLARVYLEGLRAGQNHRQAIQDIVTFPGTLAEAAPAALADLTAFALIETPSARRNSQHERRAFTFLDGRFIPESPARGPFLGLLQADTEVGLGLLRRLLDHVMAVAGRASNQDAIPLDGSSGERSIIWPETYWATRGAGEIGHALVSGLMALEVWGHQRIDAGEPVSVVVDDILGAGATPAPFVLVAVDLILSHWTDDVAEAALPLVGSPELLCMDLTRVGIDGRPEGPDIMAYFGVPQIEPGHGALTAAALKAQPSRGTSLDQVVARYAFGPSDSRARLRRALETAVARLGPIEPDMAFGDPPFMAAHMLRALDPANYRMIDLPDRGSDAFVWMYVPSEAQHAQLEALSAEKPLHDVKLHAALGAAVDDPEKARPEYFPGAVQVLRAEALEASGTDGELAGLLRLLSAVFVARHAGDVLWAELADRVEAVCAEGLSLLDDAANHGQHWLQYDPPAMAVVALICARFRAKGGDLAPLLAAVSAPSGAAVRAVRQVASLLPGIHPDLERSLLRLGLARCVWPARPWEETVQARQERRSQRADAAASRVAAELAWLGGKGPEPAWPIFPTTAQALAEVEALSSAADAAETPDEETHRWRGPTFRQGGVDVENAGRWLELAFKGPPSEPWRLALVERYGPWTIEEIVGDDDDDSRSDARASRWTHAYFSALGRVVSDLTEAQRQTLVLNPLARLGDEMPLSLVPDLLRGLDEIYFNGPATTSEVPLAVRRTVFEAIKATRQWCGMAGRWSTSLEINLGPAVAALFFNSKDFNAGPKTFLLAPAMERLNVFLDLLVEAATKGAALAPARCLLNTLEVAPRPGFTTPLLTAAEAWLVTFPTNLGFWVEQGIGRRVATLLDRLSDLDTLAFWSERARIDALLVALIAMGVPEAARLEERLFQMQAR